MSKILEAKAAIIGTFKQLNTPALPATQIDAGSKNTAPVATRFMIAEQARSYWNKEYDEAKKAAKEAGILGEEADYVEGQTITTASFKGFDITAKKAAGSEYIDKTALFNALQKHCSADKRERILAECVKTRKGAVTLSVAVK